MELRADSKQFHLKGFLARFSHPHPYGGQVNQMYLIQVLPYRTRAGKWAPPGPPQNPVSPDPAISLWITAFQELFRMVWQHPCFIGGEKTNKQTDRQSNGKEICTSSQLHG